MQHVFPQALLQEQQVGQEHFDLVHPVQGGRGFVLPQRYEDLVGEGEVDPAGGGFGDFRLLLQLKGPQGVPQQHDRNFLGDQEEIVELLVVGQHPRKGEEGPHALGEPFRAAVRQSLPLLLLRDFVDRAEHLRRGQGF